MPDYSFYSAFRRSRNSADLDENTPLSDRQGSVGFDEEEDRENTYQAPPPRPTPPSSGGCFSCQMLLLFILGGMVAYQQYTITQITSQLLEQNMIIQKQDMILNTQASHIHYLNSTIGGESGDIERLEHSTEKRMNMLEVAISKFNNTVSNSEVVSRLDEVEVDLNEMAVYMNDTLHSMLHTVSSTMREASYDIHRELDLAQTDILQRLGQTNNDLNDAVTVAKEEIQEEVEESPSLTPLIFAPTSFLNG